MRRTLALASLLVLALCARPIEAGPIVPDHTLRLPLGIADGAGHIGCLPSAIGGLEAVDLATGDVLWSTIEAQRPLLVAGDRLYAQAGIKRNRLRILVFDLKHGECLLESDPVVLPRWVVTDDGPGHAFSAHWCLERKHLVLNWEARVWSCGSPTAAELSISAQKQARGQARIDLNSGKVELRSAERRKHIYTPNYPYFLEKLAVRWHGASGKKYQALVLDELVERVIDPAAGDPSTQGQTGPGQPGAAGQPGVPGSPGTPERPARPNVIENREQRFLLYSWDLATGKPAAPVELMRGQRLLARTSTDERYLFLRNAPLSGSIRQTRGHRPRHSWTVVAAATGKEVAQLQFVPGTEAVLVVEPHVYCLVSTALAGSISKPGIRPRTFQALDLKTNQLIWERPVEGKPYDVPGRH